MKTSLILLASFITTAVSAAQLHLVTVNAPAYNCLFSPDCIITVNETLSPFTTNLPPFTGTNGSLSGFLQSRTFQGEKNSPEAGLYGYEYRLVLNQIIAADTVSIRSMTINFPTYSKFNFQTQMDKQVWAVTSGSIGTIGPSAVKFSKKKVTFQFDPPLVLSITNTPEVSSYFFGMVSSNPPPYTANGWATFSGTVKATPKSSAISFNYLTVPVRTP